ncbi:hypothetical protein ACVIKP_007361 [Rhizobium leguminosarum]
MHTTSFEVGDRVRVAHGTMLSLSRSSSVPPR